MNKSTSIAYIDFLTCLTVMFIVLFTIVFAQNKINATEGNFVQKAEFLVTLDWPDGSFNDFDLWLRDPQGKLVYFNSKNIPGVTLDRDDQGHGGKTYPIRREIITIRGKVPGEYTINVILWNKVGPEESVRVSVIKLNPYQSIIERDLSFSRKREQKTVVSFFVDKDNNILDKNTDSVDLITGVISELAH